MDNRCAWAIYRISDTLDGTLLACGYIRIYIFSTVGNSSGRTDNKRNAPIDKLWIIVARAFNILRAILRILVRLKQPCLLPCGVCVPCVCFWCVCLRLAVCARAVCPNAPARMHFRMRTSTDSPTHKHTPHSAPRDPPRGILRGTRLMFI
jgi:hypothetical protein